ncbi:MAG TPA: hypothetical protein VGU66_05070 [Candidatus Elarobacter sp.]|nr:hypothetical protein [Candidatus Elarobacter sp.]
MMNRYRNFLRAGFVALVPLLLAACQGGGANPPPFNTGNSGPPGQLSVSPSSLSFSGTGAAFAQNVTITVSVPTSQITVTPDPACGTGSNALVTIANPQQTGNTFTATVTPQHAGTCNITLSSGSGGSAQFTVTVNSGTVTISGRHAKQ